MSHNFTSISIVDKGILKRRRLFQTMLSNQQRALTIVMLSIVSIFNLLCDCSSISKECNDSDKIILNVCISRNSNGSNNL